MGSSRSTSPDCVIERMREMEVNETHSVLFTLRDSRIVRIEVFASRGGALAAASAA